MKRDYDKVDENEPDDNRKRQIEDLKDREA